MTLRMNTRIAATLLAAAIGAGAAGVALANPATDEQSEITAVAAARTAPADAVRAAEQKTGGRAVEMGLEKKANTAGYYEVLVALPDGISEVRIDPATGAVQSASQPAPRKLEDVRASELGQVTAAPVKLGDAIAAAEKKAGGRALEAGYTVANSRVVAVVEVSANNALHEVTVDGNNAQQVSLAAPAAGDGDGENSAD